jgi:NAD dependent epimerase/dehydratase family enzyme
VPTFALKLLFGEMSEMMLFSERVLPRRTQELGFKFKYPDLNEALRAAVQG